MKQCEQIQIQLSAFLDGELDQVSKERINRHLKRCQYCSNKHAALSNLKAQLKEATFNAPINQPTIERHLLKTYQEYHQSNTQSYKRHWRTAFAACLAIVCMMSLLLVQRDHHEHHPLYAQSIEKAGKSSIPAHEFNKWTRIEASPHLSCAMHCRQ